MKAVRDTLSVPVGHARRFLCGAALLGSMLLLASCAGLQPAAPYDPEIQKTVSEFDTAVQRFILDMQGVSGTEKGAYSQNVEFYTRWKVTLAHLRTRAVASDVGTSCGPDKEFDDVIEGGFKALDTAIKEADAKVKAFNVKFLEPARDKVEAKLKEAKERLVPAKEFLEGMQKRLEATRAKLIADERASLAELPKLRDAVADATAEYDALAQKVEHWTTVANRFRGVIAKTTTGGQNAFAPVIGGCTTRMMTYLYDQFEALERFHMLQEDKGIPPRRAAPILMDVPVQVILRVQERKKYLHDQGVL